MTVEDGGLRDRLADVTGVRRLDEAEQRVTTLEVAVAENAALEVALAEHVARLEQAVVAVAEGFDRS